MKVRKGKMWILWIFWNLKVKIILFEMQSYDKGIKILWILKVMLIENFNATEIKFIKVAVIACDIKKKKEEIQVLKKSSKKSYVTLVTHYSYLPIYYSYSLLPLSALHQQLPAQFMLHCQHIMPLQSMLTLQSTKS